MLTMDLSWAQASLVPVQISLYYPCQIIYSRPSCHFEFKEIEYQINHHNQLTYHGSLQFELYNFQETCDGLDLHVAVLNTPELMLMHSWAPKTNQPHRQQNFSKIKIKTIHASPLLYSPIPVLLPSSSSNRCCLDWCQANFLMKQQSRKEPLNLPRSSKFGHQVLTASRNCSLVSSVSDTHRDGNTQNSHKKQRKATKETE